jgi:uncharacterized membrane protein (DUF2068 family)
MFCSECGKEIQEDAEFCSSCGAKVKDTRVLSSMSNTPTTKKPLGIVLIAIYTGLSALLALAGGVPAMFLAQAVPQAAFLSILLIAFGVLGGATTYGLWTMEKWGYKLTKILYVISIPLGVVMLFYDRSAGNVIMQLVGITIAVWILVYLFKPETKALFRQS